MKSPYGLHIIESCLTCPLVKDRIFCNLPSPVLGALDSISAGSTYPKDAVLFVEGQEPRGVFVLCTGRVKLTMTSAEGKCILVRIAEAGEIVGLPGTLSGSPYEVTAETLEPVQANFIPRDAFLRFLREHGDASLRVAEMLTHIYRSTLMEVRYLGFARTAAGKFARFLLDLTDGPQLSASFPNNGAASASADKDRSRATLTLTHKEIGERIGASRETVTRLFSDFRRERLIEMHGSTVVLPDKPSLERLVEA
jgi:CRP/FNR family transcriptional regulator, cyclic AMP receptor protein